MPTSEDTLVEARQRYRSGDHQRAATLALAVLQTTPRHVEALRLLGIIHLSRGQLQEAVDCFRQVADQQPNDGDLHNQLGVALARMGRLEEAEGHFRALLRLAPDSFQALSNLGLVLKDRGQLHEAENCFRQALRLRPNAAETHNGLGLVLKEQGKLEEAEAELRQALRFNPAIPEIHNNLGRVLAEQGKSAEALAAHGQALLLRPDSVDTLNNLGNVLRELKRLDESEARLRQAARIAPTTAAVHINLGLTLKEQNRFDEAVACLKEAIRLKPDSVEAADSLGLVLQAQGKLTEAADCYREGLRLKPGWVPLHLHLGLLLEEMGQPDEAESYYQRALAIRPDDPEAHCSLAFLSLVRGDFERGWREYEWRWQTKKAIPQARSFRQPCWDGSSLAERTLLVYSEQGLGDAIQFVRYLPLLKQQYPSCTILFETSPFLVTLLNRSPDLYRVIPAGSPLPAFDVQIALMSLPLRLGTTLETVPARVPYLEPDPPLLEHWRRELTAVPEFKVGIFWQGNPNHVQDRFRSIPLAEYEPLARVEGVRLCSVQRFVGTEQLPAFAARCPIIDLGSRLDQIRGTFMDTAAALSALDLVITVDTATAHLAGALGVPVWVALCHFPDWRWLQQREDSPWYPTMRLFRQRQRGDWKEVFRRMAEELIRVAARPPVVAQAASLCGPTKEQAGSLLYGEAALPSPPLRILVEISAGELIDRMTLLDLLSRRIPNPADCRHIEAELSRLRSAYQDKVAPSPELEALTAALRTVHESLWEIEDSIRRCEQAQDFGPRFIEAARSFHQHSERRAGLKRQIDELLGSHGSMEKDLPEYRSP
jgi:Flp pilus assembly protein TadD